MLLWTVVVNSGTKGLLSLRCVDHNTRGLLKQPLFLTQVLLYLRILCVCVNVCVRDKVNGSLRLFDCGYVNRNIICLGL